MRRRIHIRLDWVRKTEQDEPQQTGWSPGKKAEGEMDVVTEGRDKWGCELSIVTASGIN